MLLPQLLFLLLLPLQLLLVAHADVALLQWRDLR
jgi:hypothetical protein